MQLIKDGWPANVKVVRRNMNELVLMTNTEASAHQIATAIVEPGKDGIKTKPAELMPKGLKANK